MGHASRQSKAAQLTAHPAFPLVIALWFAALIGLGSLLVSTALVERLVVALGLPSLISAAAPPLGTTAKVALALAGAVFGAVLGLFLGRTLYRSGQEKAQAVSPINAHEELGANGLDGEDAPLPLAGEVAEEEAEAFDQAPQDEAEDEDDEDDEAWDLAWLDDEEALAGEPFPLHAADEAAPPEDAPEPVAETLAESVVEPAAKEEAPAPEPVQDAEPEPAPQPVPRGVPNIPLETPAQRNTALDDLSLIELAQRLQSAIGERRALQAAAPAAIVAEKAAAQDEEPALAIHAQPEVSPEPVAPVQTTPEPAPQDAPEAESEAPPPPPKPQASAIHHPAHKPFLEADELVAADVDVALDDETALGETYSSLLAMTASVRAQPEEPREEAEDTPTAPEAQAEAASAPTLATLDRAGGAAPATREVDPQEKALREALMNLHQFNTTN